MRPSAQRRQALGKLAALVLQQRSSHPLRLAIDGVDAAGKTCLADELAEILASKRPVVRASLDNFHRLREKRYRRGRLSPLGYYQDSFDYPALIESLLLPLGPGGDRRYRLAVFDYRLDTRVESERLEANNESILVFDGIFLLRPELRQYWDYSIFVQVDFPTALERAAQRESLQAGSPADQEDTRQLMGLYEERYIPAQKLYLEEAHPHRYANVVWDNCDLDRPVLIVR